MAPGWYKFKFNVGWTLNIYVKDSDGSPIQNSTISISNNLDEILLSGLTNKDGAMMGINIFEYTYYVTGNAQTKDSYTPHAISVKLPNGETAKYQIIMSSSKNLTYKVGSGFSVTENWRENQFELDDL